MLDTNAVSELIRRPIGAVAQRVGLVGSSDICTSIIVSAEVRYGAEKRGSARLSQHVEAVLGAMEIAAWETPADRVFGHIRSALERSGDMIGEYDLLIAAHALALGCVLVTDNEREFARVPGLKIENWLRDDVPRS